MKRIKTVEKTKRFAITFSECESAGGNEVAKYEADSMPELLKKIMKFISKLSSRAFSGDDRLEMDLDDNKKHESHQVDIVSIRALRIHSYGDYQDKIIPLPYMEEDIDEEGEDED